MISVLSWNIQNGLGVDGERSLERIADVILQNQCPDVLCLQEVSRNLPLDIDTDGPDQVAQLAALFPAHTPFFGPAYDLLHPDSAQRMQYGNMILSRLPVLSSFCHPLPQPPRVGKKQMPRQVTEVTVATTNGPLRIMTTHLEFHSVGQRSAQMHAIKQIHDEISELADNLPAATAFGPYQTLVRAGNAVLCGDFNCLPESKAIQDCLAPGNRPESQLLDAWRYLHPTRDYEPTCGVFDAAQWPEGPHCRDFFLVSSQLQSRVQAIETDTQTAASDHQPIILHLSH